MSKIILKKQKNALVYLIRTDKGQSLDDTCWKTLLEEQPQGLIIPACQTDKNITLVYETAGYVPIADYLRKPINLLQFCFLLKQVTARLREIGACMPDMQKLLLDIEYVMMHANTQEIAFIYIPVQDLDSQTSAKQLFLDAVKKAAFNKTVDAKRVRGAFQSTLQSGDDFSLDQLENFIDRMCEQPAEEPPALEQRPIPTAPSRPAEPVKINLFKRAGLNSKIPCLFRESNGEKIFIRMDYFKIGKDPSQSDYVVTANNRISRLHAVIEVEGKRFYITDLESTNRTYVNGQLLSPGVKTEIRPGASIRLADERFTFDVTN